MKFSSLYHNMNKSIAPDDALIEKTLHQMKQTNTSPAGRNWRFPKAATAVATAAVVLAAGCGTTALAVNVPAVYATLYAISPAAAQFFVPVNESCEDQGIIMEVVSVSVQGDTAEVNMTLRDPDGSLFRENAPDLYDSYSLHYPVRSGQSCGCELVSYDVETHTATYHLTITNMNHETFRGGKYTFSVRELLTGRLKQEGIDVNPDLSNVSRDPATERRDVTGGSSIDPNSDCFNLREYDFLRPQGTLWESEDGLFRLEAVGYRGNQLHLLYIINGSYRYDNHGWFDFYAPDGSLINPVYTVCRNEQEADTSYYEYIYDIPYEDIPACSLSGDLYTASNHISGNWRVTFRI